MTQSELDRIRLRWGDTDKHTMGPFKASHAPEDITMLLAYIKDLEGGPIGRLRALRIKGHHADLQRRAGATGGD